jgi:deoxyribose-phosphate aldolase
MKHLNQVRSQVVNRNSRGTKLGFEHGKIVKWIIEVAALNDKQIIQLSALIKNVL